MSLILLVPSPPADAALRLPRLGCYGGPRRESNLVPSQALFAGDARIFVYEIFAPDGITMQDVSAFSLAYTLRRAADRIDPHRTRTTPALVEKTTADGIRVTTGLFHPARALNRQRVLVTLTDVNTALLVRGGLYVDALKRTDDGLESVLSYGTIPVLVPATT